MTTRVTHVEAKMKYPLLSSLSKAFLSSASSFFLANRSCEKQNKMSIVTDSKLTEQCVSLTYASNLCHIVKRCKQQALRRGRGKRTSSSSDDYGGRWRAVSWSWKHSRRYDGNGLLQSVNLTSYDRRYSVFQSAGGTLLIAIFLLGRVFQSDRFKAKFSDFFLRSNCLSSRIFRNWLFLCLNLFIALYSAQPVFTRLQLISKMSPSPCIVNQESRFISIYTVRPRTKLTGTFLTQKSTV